MYENFDVVGLYAHNVEAYEKIKKGYENSDVVGIVHATGTGKSYLGIQLVYDNKSLKTLWLVPNNSIIEHIIKSINDNPKLDMDVDFPNLELRTYRNLVNMSFKELSDIDVDLLILDEFHHIGAPIWGDRVETIIDTHPDVKVFGMTAYTVRDRGTSYERDMALDNSDELFSNNIVSRYDLCDAIIDGVLPMPIYKSSYVKLLNISNELEQRVKKLELSGRECSQYNKILSDAKRRIHEAASIGNIIKNNIKKHGKYIYFCPSFTDDEENDVETIKQEAMSWFKELTSEDDIVFYTSLSEMPDGGKSNRDAFYDDLDLDGNDVSNKLRVMFAINQYNEGVHAPNIDGVIMGRGTVSDIVFFEQLGRALSVSSDNGAKKNLYSSYSLEELRILCLQKKINYDMDMSKDVLVKKLVAPVIIDLAGNIDFIIELQDNLKDRVRELKESGVSLNRGYLTDVVFDLDLHELDLFNILLNLRHETDVTWDQWYGLAKNYYLEHENLKVPFAYVTDKGDKLGIWIHNQRKTYLGMKSSDKFERKALTDEQISKLEAIGMVWNALDDRWEMMYNLAVDYFFENGNSMIPLNYVTESGVFLGRWVQKQRIRYRDGKLPMDRIEKLSKINMVLDNLVPTWDDWYEMAEAYYNEYHNLDVRTNYITKDGYKLGYWISNTRRAYQAGKLSDFQINQLKKLGMRFEKMSLSWDQWYEIVEEYYLEHGNSDVPNKYVTSDGKCLGSWCVRQKTLYNNGKLTSDQIEKLKKIKFKFESDYITWDDWYEIAKNYYLKHGNLEVPTRFVTSDGYKLGHWICNQRVSYRKGALTQEQVNDLLKIGMRFGKLDIWQQWYEVAKEYYLEHGNLDVPCSFLTSDGKKLGVWIIVQRRIYKKGDMSHEHAIMLESIGMIWNTRINKSELDELFEDFNIDIEKNKKITEHMSITEFRVKLAYLKDRKVSIVDQNGLLHEIFSMSSLNMQAKYNVSLEGLVNMYGNGKSNVKKK